MAISLALETKSNLDLSKESKDAGLTWDEATWTWDEAESTWELPKLSLDREDKSKISLTNELK